MAIIKHLDNNTKHQELLFCYNFVDGVTNEEKNVLLAIELNLLTISTIISLELGILATTDAPPHSLKNSNVNPKVKMEEKGIGVHSLARSTLEVERCVKAIRWRPGQVTSGSIIHTHLHKPNNKLVSA
jgi:hypothetical protein